MFRGDSVIEDTSRESPYKGIAILQVKDCGYLS
jgi:hypothetical protein